MKVLSNGCRHEAATFTRLPCYQGPPPAMANERPSPADVAALHSMPSTRLHGAENNVATSPSWRVPRNPKAQTRNCRASVLRWPSDVASKQQEHAHSYKQSQPGSWSASVCLLPVSPLLVRDRPAHMILQPWWRDPATCPFRKQDSVSRKWPPQTQSSCDSSLHP